MRIRFIQTFSSPKEVFHAGNEYDVDNHDAISYMDRGLARKAPESGNVPTLTPKPAGQFVNGEQLGVALGLPNATPAATPTIPPADNPIGGMHPGMTTSEPSASVSPPSDGPSPAASPNSGTTPTSDEPRFAGRPLSAYDGKDDDAIRAMTGVSENTVKKIRAAQAERAAK